MKDNRMAAAGLLVGLFLSGAVAGGAAVHFLDSRSSLERSHETRRDRDDDDRRRGRPGDPRSFTSTRVLDRLEDRLGLTTEQRDSVETILEGQRSAASEVFREMGPALRATIDSANARIRGVLDEEQRVRFDELLRQDRGVLGRPPPSGDHEGR